MNSKNKENSIALVNTAEGASTALPDLVMNDIAVPVEVVAGEEVEVVWTITNQGDGPAWGSYTQVYLSEDNQVGGDTYLGQFRFDSTIWAGQEVTRRESIRLPIGLEGDYSCRGLRDIIAINDQSVKGN